MYLAIDGGGTKTEYWLLDEKFQMIGCCFGGCVNHDFLEKGWEGAKQELCQSIHTLLNNNNLKVSDIRDVAVGLSGVDNREDWKKMNEIFREIGFTEFSICNDGFLAIWAECSDGVGIAYNCGTGVCCAGIDEMGRQEKIAGLDEWSGDAGGGNWIVQNVFRLVYKSLILHRKETALAAAYKKKFFLKTEEDFLNSWSMLKNPLKYPKMTKDVVTLFFEELEEGEEEVEQLAEQMAAYAVENIQALIKRLTFSMHSVPVILTGSIHMKAANKAYLTLLEKRMEERIMRPLAIGVASKRPVEGAVRWLKKNRTKII